MTLNEWFSSVDEGYGEARRLARPVLLYFYSNTCFYCQRFSMVVYRQQEVFDLVGNEFVGVRVSPETPDLFRAYAVSHVPAWVVTGADGFEYERLSGFRDKEEFSAFCLLALGKFYHDRGESETAQRHLERLVFNHPQSPYAPEGFFLHGLCSYLNTRDPQHFKDAFQKISQTHPESPWCKRSLVLYAHPSAVVDWDAARRQNRNYWDSEDAFAKCFATYFYPLTEHQHQDDEPSS